MASKLNLLEGAWETYVAVRRLGGQDPEQLQAQKEAYYAGAFGLYVNLVQAAHQSELMGTEVLGDMREEFVANGFGVPLQLMVGKVPVKA